MLAQLEQEAAQTTPQPDKSFRAFVTNRRALVTKYVATGDRLGFPLQYFMGVPKPSDFADLRDRAVGAIKRSLRR